MKSLMGVLTGFFVVFCVVASPAAVAKEKKKDDTQPQQARQMVKPAPQKAQQKGQKEVRQQTRQSQEATSKTAGAVRGTATVLGAHEKLTGKNNGSKVLGGAATGIETYGTHQANQRAVASGQVSPTYAKERETVNHLLNFGMANGVGVGKANSATGGAVERNTMRTLDKAVFNRDRDVCIAAGEKPDCLVPNRKR